jgi:heme/copper-type cytochrome/quinol oxidase subunit 1
MFWVAFSGLPRRVHDFPLMYLGWQSMSTVGHFTTMIGVLCFYTSLMESSFEKKITTYIYNLIPRMYTNSSYLLYKNLNTIINVNNKTLINKKKTRNYILKNNKQY